MAIARKIDRKAPTQNPHAFFACEQHGGAHGSPQKIPLKLASGDHGTTGGTGGKLRESIDGRKDLDKQ